MPDNLMAPSAVFAQRLRETRRARGITQSELAELMTARGRPMSQSALLRIEKGTRGLTLDEAIAFAALLPAVPANLLTPPDGAIVMLTDAMGLRGGEMRDWLRTGDPNPSFWPPIPYSEASLQAVLERSLAIHATALLDSLRSDDKPGKLAALREIQHVVDRHRDALAELDAKGGDRAE